MGLNEQNGVLEHLKPTSGTRLFGETASRIGELGFASFREEHGFIAAHLPLGTILVPAVDTASIPAMQFFEVEAAEDANGATKVLFVTGDRNCQLSEDFFLCS